MTKNVRSTPRPAVIRPENGTPTKVRAELEPEPRPSTADAVKATRLEAGEVAVVDSHAPKLVPR